MFISLSCVQKFIKESSKNIGFYLSIKVLGRCMLLDCPRDSWKNYEVHYTYNLNFERAGDRILDPFPPSWTQACELAKVIADQLSSLHNMTFFI